MGVWRLVSRPPLFGTGRPLIIFFLSLFRPVPSRTFKLRAFMFPCFILFHISTALLFCLTNISLRVITPFDSSDGINSDPLVVNTVWKHSLS